MSPDPAPLFTPEQVKDDARNRIAKTGGQVGGATALVGAAQWIAQQAGWHGSLDGVTFGYFVTLVTIVASVVTNRTKLRGEGGQTLVQVLIAIVVIILILKLLGAW